MPRLTTQYDPDYAVAPGETLAEVLTERKMSKTALADRTGLSRKAIHEILAGKAALTPATANLLELATGVPARIWNGLESSYRERLEKLAQRQRLAAHEAWASGFPYEEMARRKTVAATKDVITRIAELLRFFEVASPDAWESVWKSGDRALLRQSLSTEPKRNLTATWLQEAIFKARRADLPPYSSEELTRNLPALRALTANTSRDFTDRMNQLMSRSGVALVFVREYPGAAIKGAAIWESSKPIIALNLLGRYHDIFWFTFFHEVCHILRHGKRHPFVDSQELPARSDEPVEKEANDFAADILIPKAYKQQMLTLRSAATIARFARDIGVHPGVVVGQLHHLQVLPHTHLNALRCKLKWTTADHEN